ncbi:unnamed protein product [Amoebophrya sp. A25]|nr:unnamed protein product [Amoebophrya sp. A25]|eukprot:GSA25T00014823001.1
MSSTAGRMLPPALRSKGKGKGKVKPAQQGERLLPREDEDGDRGNGAPRDGGKNGHGKKDNGKDGGGPSKGKGSGKKDGGKKGAGKGNKDGGKGRRPKAVDSDDDDGDGLSARAFNPFHTAKKDEKTTLNFGDNYDYENLRQERFNARRAGGQNITRDTVGEDEGTKEANPTVEVEHAHGYKLEGFNMDRELEEGRIDDREGAFVFDVKDELRAVTDRWLDEVDKGSKEAQMSNKDLSLMREREQALVDEMKVTYDPSRLKKELSGLLLHGETPSAAMSRLNTTSSSTPGASSRSAAGASANNAAKSNFSVGGSSSSSSKFLLPHERKKRKLEKQAAEKRAAEEQQKSATTGGKKRKVFDPVWGVWVEEKDKTSATGEQEDKTSAPAPDGLSLKNEVLAGPRRALVVSEATKLEARNKAEEAGRIGELCNLLLELGAFDIYETPKEKIYTEENRVADVKKEEKKTAEMSDMMKDLLDDDDDEDDEDEGAPGAPGGGAGVGAPSATTTSSGGAGVGAAGVNGARTSAPTSGPTTGTSSSSTGASCNGATTTTSSTSAKVPASKKLTEKDGPFWQYQMGTDIHGPFTSGLMLTWKPLLSGKGLQVRSCDLKNIAMDPNWKKYEEIDFGLYV